MARRSNIVIIRRETYKVKHIQKANKKYKTDLDEVREIRNKRYLKRNKEYQKMFVKTKDKQDYIDWLNDSIKTLRKIDDDVTQSGAYPDWLYEMRVIRCSLATQRGKV